MLKLTSLRVPFADAEMNAITDFNRKKQIRFKSIDDIKLLREVVANNPFKNKGKWTEIAESLSKPGFILDGRRVRERTQLLIDQHRRENAENIKASGTDEVVEEKTTLLDEILELREEDERVKREEKDKKEKTENMGKEIRKRALECLTPQKGNDIIHQITANKNHELLIVMEDFDQTVRYAHYGTFFIGNENEKYKLNVTGYSGTAGDSLAFHNGLPFSTYDQDNDSDSRNCAVIYKGNCYPVNTEESDEDKGINSRLRHRNSISTTLPGRGQESAQHQLPPTAF
ncbi:hypothetical protein FSP39_003443 [Pinctada imbricata]|uniref:Fibrinogen C-terminal domain-containing protein n=1 Tax=Pinctada imbricata TaxID=66713 RepID=A0AA88XCE7_PINIB|nr:hypothetical protein FSP39_003443 [Pinctada imbricata]